MWHTPRLFSSSGSVPFTSNLQTSKLLINRQHKNKNTVKTNTKSWTFTDGHLHFAFYFFKCIIVQRVIVCILLEIYKNQEFQKQLPKYVSLPAKSGFDKRIIIWSEWVVGFELMLDALAMSRRKQAILWWGEGNYYLICSRPTYLVGYL